MDAALRELERRALQGDPRAALQLERELLRLGTGLRFPVPRVRALAEAGEWNPLVYHALFWNLLETDEGRDVLLEVGQRPGAAPWESNPISYTMLRAYRMGDRGRVELTFLDHNGEEVAERYYMVESPFAERGFSPGGRLPWSRGPIDWEISTLGAVAIPGTGRPETSVEPAVPSILAGTTRGFRRYGQRLRSPPENVMYPRRYLTARIMESTPIRDPGAWGRYRWKNNPQGLLLDLRSRKEASGDPVSGARVLDIPLPPLSARDREGLTRKLKRVTSGLSRAHPIRVFCAKGKRSKVGVQILRRLGFVNVKDLGGRLKKNPDPDLRRLERAWKETGLPRDEAAWLQGRVRAGTLSRGKLRMASALGYEPAALVEPVETDLDPPGQQAVRPTFVRDVLGFGAGAGDEYMLWLSVACCRSVIHFLDEVEWTEGNTPEEFLEIASDWIREWAVIESGEVKRTKAMEADLALGGFSTMESFQELELDFMEQREETEPFWETDEPLMDRALDTLRSLAAAIQRMGDGFESVAINEGLAVYQQAVRTWEWYFEDEEFSYEEARFKAHKRVLDQIRAEVVPWLLT